MDKLNELVEMAKASDGKWFATAINPESILAIAEAFRELEQRAQAAEAQLDELAKQKGAVAEDEDGNPVGFISWYERKFVGQAFKGTGHVADCDDAWRAAIEHNPAPAVSLAEMVPDAMPKHEKGSAVDSTAHWCDGYNACRAAILRNIEEAK